MIDFSALRIPESTGEAGRKDSLVQCQMSLLEVDDEPVFPFQTSSFSVQEPVSLLNDVLVFAETP